MWRRRWRRWEMSPMASTWPAWASSTMRVCMTAVPIVSAGRRQSGQKTVQDYFMNQLYKFLKLSDIPIFSANFICMFKMDYYPFDTQVCEVGNNVNPLLRVRTRTNMRLCIQVALFGQIIYSCKTGSCHNRIKSAATWFWCKHFNKEAIVKLIRECFLPKKISSHVKKYISHFLITATGVKFLDW